MRRTAAVWVVVLLCAVLLVGCNGQKSSGGDSSGTDSGEEYLIGEIIVVGTLTVKLNGVRRLPTDEFDIPTDPNNTFVAVDVTLENTGSGSETIGVQSQFSLIDIAGQEAAHAKHGEAHVLGEDELSTGRTRRGEVVFEVPPDSQGLKLVFDPVRKGSGVVTWGIGDLANIK